MSSMNAALSGHFMIGGELRVTRLGFGAMRITGPGIWGEPHDRAEALRALRALPDLGVNFIDTADSYGPEVSERLIHEALYPYKNVFVATKAGLLRPGANEWAPNGHPKYLIAQAHKSRDILGVDRIDLWQLHRIDPSVPREDQFAAVKELIDSGVIRFAGLSEVSVEEIKAAQAVFPVATVQNRYNLTDRHSEDVLDYCEAQEIGFIPWFPLAAGSLVQPGGSLDTIAPRNGATAGQIALAWALKRSPIILPIPGTSKLKHLEENVAAATIKLSDQDFAALNRANSEA